ncbi:DUF1150 family protein [Pseudochrobactrum algeriensis]|uniref:DUF1150 family protein n=2 Tax=Pseudochrobactrum TaxID=354349 RepID=A0A7W8AH30_9HYPH|nr:MULTISPECIES: DUF1150 family protein [Brucellaceae]MBX8782356.1 DUF1150 family protein [Ochrobactrum sp. GRS2]MBX8813143.1 DUF1150 family protein [Ochrobactrum sp. MR34]KAB0540617.1 DUF1150 family protein [Pseudochrobactrum saccharolyticum]MBB5090183.1 hypothetical protein [Pseudochrobactrum saccharolyticum]MBX8824354.1 DUF1150 family protein [Ochrobactrum sp. SFR4]
MTADKHIFTEFEFAHLGEGEIAYLRKVRSEDLSRRFPALPPMAPGMELWALFGASGTPIMLSDMRATALAGAQEHELHTVMLH